MSLGRGMTARRTGAKPVQRPDRTRDQRREKPRYARVVAGVHSTGRISPSEFPAAHHRTTSPTNSNAARNWSAMTRDEAPSAPLAAWAAVNKGNDVDAVISRWQRTYHVVGSRRCLSLRDGRPVRRAADILVARRTRRLARGPEPLRCGGEPPLPRAQSCCARLRRIESVLSMGARDLRRGRQTVPPCACSPSHQASKAPESGH